MGNIIAIVGMCGSGKSVACETFENMGYTKIYFGSVTMDELKKQNLEVTSENEKMVREQIRKIHGMGAYAKLLLPKIEKLSQKGNIILDGLYSWEELEILKNEYPNLKLVAIVTDKDIRYARLEERVTRKLTKEEAQARDIAEIENINKAGPIAYADYFLINNGSKEELTKKIKDMFS